MSELENGEVRCETVQTQQAIPLTSSRPQWLSVRDLLRIALFCNLAQMGKGFLRPHPFRRSNWPFKLAVPRAEGVTFFSSVATGELLNANKAN